MAYSKHTWSDRVVEFFRRYRDQNNVQYTFTPDEGTVINAGTPVTAQWLNEMETGIETLDTTTVKLTGDQSINGAKTFGWFPYLPGSSPTNDYHAATKKYVDDKSMLVASYTLSTSTSLITISGLDIIGHGGIYEIDIQDLIPATASSYLYMYINGDTTATNYYSVDDANSSANTPRISDGNSSYTQNGTIFLKLTANGKKATASSIFERTATSSVAKDQFGWQTKNTQTNITSISFATDTGTINAGAIIKIYKR